MSAENRRDPDHWFRIWMPYVFDRIEGQRYKHCYIPLNRNYKPLGCRGEEWVKYEEMKDRHVYFVTDISNFEGIWWHRARYLYDDSEESLRDYGVRLGRLTQKSMRLLPLKADNADDEGAEPPMVDTTQQD